MEMSSKGCSLTLPPHLPLPAQLSPSSVAVPSLPAIAEAGVLPNGSAAAAAAPPDPAGSRGRATGALPRLQEQQQQQQHQGVAGAAVGSTEAGAGVRRTASFGDAVSRLSYGALHRQQSPWKDVSSSKPMLRPRSARMSDQLGRRGQAVFMLQSTDGGELASADGSPAAASTLPPPVPSPRLSACISLPTVREHSPARQQQPGEGSSSACCTPPPSSLQQADRSTGLEGAAAAAGPPASVPPLQLDSSEQHWLSQQQELEQASAGSQSEPAGSPAAPQLSTGQQEGGARVPAAPGALPAEPQRGRPAQHSSVAAADAAAAAAAGTGPVFVPICLAVPDGEYEGMLQDWVERQEQAYAGSGSRGAGSSTARDAQEGGQAGRTLNGVTPRPATASCSVPASEGVARLQAVQAHLRRYGASGVPVVELDMSDMGAALDAMHAYVLQCIALATGERDYR